MPVAPPEARTTLGGEVDEFVCLAEPSPFHAIGLHYRDFHQVGDEEVRAALDAAAGAVPALKAAGARGSGRALSALRTS